MGKQIKITLAPASGRLLPMAVLAGLCLLALLAGFFLTPGQLLSLLRDQWEVLSFYTQNYPIAFSFVFILGYAFFVACFIPGHLALMLLSGALFGPVSGAGHAVVGNIAGACAAFLAARFLFFRQVEARYGHHLTAVNRGLRKHGILYLILLRLIPLLPAPAVTLLMAVTVMPLKDFFLGTLVGAFPLMLIYAVAGSQLRQLEADDLMAPHLLTIAFGAGSLLILAILLVRRYRRRAQK